VESTVSSQDGDSDRQVEAGAFLFEVGGREIDGDAGGRELEPGVAHGGADAVARLADGGVRQAYGRELLLLGFDTGEVDLDVDQIGIDAVDGGTASFEEHGPRTVSLRCAERVEDSIRAENGRHRCTRTGTDLAARRSRCGA
jgi:hypothetical protein